MITSYDNVPIAVELEVLDLGRRYAVEERHLHQPLVLLADRQVLAHHQQLPEDTRLCDFTLEHLMLHGQSRLLLEVGGL